MSVDVMVAPKLRIDKYRWQDALNQARAMYYNFKAINDFRSTCVLRLLLEYDAGDRSPELLEALLATEIL
jgi:hypothetical protein